jgi:DNA repair protein RadC
MDFKHSLPIMNVRLSDDMSLYSERPIKTATDAVNLVADYLHGMTREMAFVICLDAAMCPICVGQIGLGTEVDVPISIRDTLQIALLSNASAAIMIHNHPSRHLDGWGLSGSKDDIRITDLMIKALALAGIKLHDSIVVNGYYAQGKYTPAYFSIREKRFSKLVKMYHSESRMGADAEKKDTALDWDNAKGKVSAFWENHNEDSPSNEVYIAQNTAQLKQINERTSSEEEERDL